MSTIKIGTGTDYFRLVQRKNTPPKRLESVKRCPIRKFLKFLSRLREIKLRVNT